MRYIRHHARGVDPGEVTVRPGRVRKDAVSRTTDALRQAAPEAALSADDIRAGDRAALFRPSRRQDAHRDAHQRHAAQRRLLQLAVHVRAVVEQSGARRGAERWSMQTGWHWHRSAADYV